MPERADGWSGIRDATEDGVVCTTRNVYVKDKFFLYGEEDCLYLNVYTPQVSYLFCNIIWELQFSGVPYYLFIYAETLILFLLNLSAGN